MDCITIDFETRSRVDVRKTGSSRYARDPSTIVLCLAYSIKGKTKVWKQNDLPPYDLFEALEAGALIEAHNVGFERNIWEHVCVKKMGWIPIYDWQWRCSMAACCRVALPRSLEHAAEALKLDVKKDKAGSLVMRQLSQPRKPTKNNPSEWDDTPSKFQRLYAYCAQDVEVEKKISRLIPPLTPFELDVWQLDQRINQRGIQIDVPAVQSALECVDLALAQARAELSKITGGAVASPTEVANLMKWLNDQGIEITDLTKQTVTELLDTDLPDPVRQALAIRQSSSKSSTAKLRSMLDRCDEDGRIRGNLVYHGASTGRWSGSGVQIQNFPRGSLSLGEIELVHRLLPARDIDSLDSLLGPPMDVISSALRSFLISAPGHRLLVGDFAQIEARVAAWIAGEKDLIEGFRAGEDVYKPMAAKIYSKAVDDVTKGERQLGKVAVLGCQYGLGAGGFQAAVKAMAGTEVDKPFAKQAVAAYRAANPRIKAIWKELNTAAIRTIQTGKKHRVGPLEMRTGLKTLQVKLPSGRSLHYWFPELKTVRAPWSEGYIGKVHLPSPDEAEEQDIEIIEAHGDGWYECKVPKSAARWVKAQKLEFDLEPMEPQYIQQVEYHGVHSQMRKWLPIRTYGGMLFENIVQAIARDFLAEAMLRLDRSGYAIIGTVHDEVICEMPEGVGSLDEFDQLLRGVPPWGKGCPIDTEVFESRRYRK